jgi:WD40 repeat protein
MIRRLNGSVCSVAFSPDGERVVSGSDDHTIRIWHARTREEMAALKGHDRYVTSVAFSPDGERVVSGSYDYTILTSQKFDSSPLSAQWKSFDEQGWMLGKEEQRLFWIPPQYRLGLCWPETHVITMIGAHKTLFNMANFVCGERWTDCIEDTRSGGLNVSRTQVDLSSPS